MDAGNETQGRFRVKTIRQLGICMVVIFAFVLALSARADDISTIGQDREAVEKAFKKPGYSPYAGRNFPTRVLWGDTHLHTSLSLDARAFGTTLGPEEAYRFARGEEVTTSHGERVKLARPLDWLVVADHSDAMGTMNEIVKGNPDLMRDQKVKDWHDRINQGGETALIATMEVIETFAGVSGEKIPEILMDRDFVGSIWERYLETAEKYNEPGHFTTIIGYEWTSTEPLLRRRASILRISGNGWKRTRRKPAAGYLLLPTTAT
jgi:hypothetical protein